MVDK
jgi:hypothetical protein